MAERKTTARKTAPRKRGKGGPGSPKAVKKKSAPKKTSPPAAAKGRRLGAAKQGLRDSYVMALRAQGLTWEEVGAEVGLSASQAQRVAAERRKVMPIQLDMDPARIVEAAFEGFQASVADLERIALAAAEKEQLAVAVGAKKGANEAREKILALLQATGRLPQELGALRHLIDLRAVAVKMLDTMDRFEEAVRVIELTEEQRDQLDEAVAGARGTFHDLIGIEEAEPAQLPAAA